MRDIKKLVKTGALQYRPLLGIQNAKTIKGEDLGYITGIMYLAPADIVNGLNLCPYASAGCKKSCLFSAGRGRFNNVYSARIAKTEFFRDNLNSFFYSIERDINKIYNRAKKQGKKCAIRLNGTSDIRWELYRDKNGKNIFELYPKIQFYDYTKDWNRVEALTGHWNNYHLTYSMSESIQSKKQAVKLLKLGVNVAIVFSQLPNEFLGYEVINGDKHDLRFLDRRGVIVGLTPKGAAKNDKSGFVQYINKNTLQEAA